MYVDKVITDDVILEDLIQLEEVIWDDGVYDVDEKYFGAIDDESDFGGAIAEVET